MVTVSYRPGQVDIQEFYIYTPNGKRVDLINLFVEFNLYENIYSYSLTGTITMVDTHNLISETPLLGEEFVVFTYKVFDTDEARTIHFRTYKIDDRRIDGNKQMYKIHLMTFEAYKDASMNISRKLQGTSDTIIRQLLQTELSSSKQMQLDDSANSLHLVVPYWSPFSCIAWAAQKALSKDSYRNADYLFFETPSGYKFNSMSSTFQNPPVEYFKHNQDRNVDGEFTRDYNKEYAQVINLETKIISDQVERIMSNVYKNHTIVHDITFKSVNGYDYNLAEDWDKSNHLNANPHFSSSMTSSISADYTVANASSYTHDSKYYDWQGLVTNRRMGSLMRLDSVKLKIEVWGRMGIESGNVVHLDIGKFTQSELKSDLYYTGNYLVSAIMHRFAQKEYKQYIELVSESSANKF